jgi:hypothetical protein
MKRSWAILCSLSIIVFGFGAVKGLDLEIKRYQSDLDLLRIQGGRLREILKTTQDTGVEKLSKVVYVIIDTSISIDELNGRLMEIDPFYNKPKSFHEAASDQ